MAENLTHIFSCYLADLLESGKFDLNDTWYVSQEFAKVCEQVKTREDLLNFLGPFLNDYPEFSDLKVKLENKNFIFNYI